jgi:DNA transformation protein and related proteins
MTASTDFAEFLRDALAPLGGVTLRRMFGATGVFCDGVMLGMVSHNALYLRVDELNRGQFKPTEGSAPMSYMKGGRSIDLAFWRVPDRLLDEPPELVDWARAALAAAHRVAAQRGPKPRNKSG